MSKTKLFRVILKKEPEGTYTATIPSLPGCTTWGNTIEHAIEMAGEAAKGYLEVLKEEGENIPDDNETLEYSLFIHDSID
jgi:predicted RNase H-like HicB family nuclease